MSGEPGRSLHDGIILPIADIEVGAQAHMAGFGGRREHALPRQCSHEPPRLFDPDEHYVGLRRLDGVAEVDKADGKSASALVVLGEPTHVMLEGIQGGGCYDAGLAQSATERFAGTSRLPDSCLVSC